jgi:two-component system, chemotaxis family, chemotaxis protein CheY
MESDFLVVDHSAAIRKILQRVLRQTGVPIGNVYEASNGKEALSLLETTSVDLILSEINMPEMDGLQLLASLKTSTRWRHIPVIMITTEGSAIKVADAGRLGAAGYLRKPFSAEQIKDKLTGIFEPIRSL